MWQAVERPQPKPPSDGKTRRQRERDEQWEYLKAGHMVVHVGWGTGPISALLVRSKRDGYRLSYRSDPLPKGKKEWRITADPL